MSLYGAIDGIRTRSRLIDSQALWPIELRRQNVGGASRDRTDDLLLARQVLSQLSYGPEYGASGRI